MINRFKTWLSGVNPGDLSKHRAHAHLYEDLCM